MKSRVSLLRGILIVLALFFIGLTPYTYLIWAARSAPVINWGSIDSFKELVNHFLRVDYGTFSASVGSAVDQLSLRVLLNRLTGFLAGVSYTFTPFGVLLLFAGIFKSIDLKEDRKKIKDLVLFFFLIFLISGPLFISYLNLSLKETASHVARFYLLPILILTIFFAFSIFVVSKMMHSFKVSILLIVALPLYLLLSGLSFNNLFWSLNRLAQDYASNVFKTAGKQDILVISGDGPTFTTLYLQNIEGIYKDRINIAKGVLGLPWAQREVVKRYPELQLDFKLIYSGSWLDVFEPHLKDRRILTNFVEREILKNENIEVVPLGILYWVKPKEEQIEAKKIYQENNNFWQSYDLSDIKAPEISPFFFESGIVKTYAESFYWAGNYYQKHEMLSEAEEFYKKSINMNRHYFYAYNNLGLVYTARREYQKAAQIWEEAVAQSDRRRRVPVTIYGNLATVYSKDYLGDIQKASFYRKLFTDFGGGAALEELDVEPIQKF